MTPWTAAYQVPLYVGFSRQEYWSGCHFLLQGVFLIQGLSLCLLHWQAGATGKPNSISTSMKSKNAMCLSVTEKAEEQKLRFLQIVTIYSLSFTIVIKEMMILMFFWVC